MGNLVKIPKSKLILGSDVIRDYSLLTKLAGKKVFSYTDGLLRMQLLEPELTFDEDKTHRGKLVGFSFEKKTFEVLTTSGKVVSNCAIAVAEEIEEYLVTNLETLFEGYKKGYRHKAMSKTVMDIPQIKEKEDWEIVEENFI